MIHAFHTAKPIILSLAILAGLSLNLAQSKTLDVAALACPHMVQTHIG